MADLSQPLDQILTAQSQKEVTANELIDALSASAIYGRRAVTSAGLTHGYNGGRFNSILIAHGTVALTDNATTYVVAHRTTGAVSVSTSITNWNDTATYLRTYLYTTVAGVVTVREDHRQAVGGSGAGGGSVSSVDVSGGTTGLTTSGGPVTGSGTITLAGTLDVDNGGTGQVTAQAAINSLSAVSGATNEHVLTKDTASGNAIFKAAAAGGGVATDVIWDAKGDLAGGTGSNTAVRLAVGTNGHVLTADSVETTGMKWAATSGGSLTHFTESVNTTTPNASIPVVRLLATNAASDVDIAINPKGFGNIATHVADNTTAGGNKRGNRAIDFQSAARSNADQVASGADSVLIGGEANRASGSKAVVIGGSNGLASASNCIVLAGTLCTASNNFAVAGGSSCTASGIGSFAMGENCTASAQNAAAHGLFCVANALYSRAGGQSGTTRTVIGADAWGGGQFNGVGDFQRRAFVLRKHTTDATSSVITTNGNPASTNNQVNCPSGAACFITGHAIVTQPATGDTATWTFSACINNIGGTTALVGAATVTAGPASAGAATWTLAITADNTNDSFTFTVTGEAAHTLAWVACVFSVEAGPM